MNAPRFKWPQSPRGPCALVAAVLWFGAPASAWPQSIVATLPVGGTAAALNHVTNTLYVINTGRSFSNSLNVLDGATRSISSVQLDARTTAVAVNETTNKIYVARAQVCNYAACTPPATVTVIDGTTYTRTPIAVPNMKGYPCAIGVNPSTDRIYVVAGSNVLVIDGATNSVTAVADPNAASLACAIAVNPVTNAIYVAESATGNVIAIDGATNLTTTIVVANAIGPVAMAVNTAANKIYVANAGNYPGAGSRGNVTVIDGATNASTIITDPNAVAPQAVAVNQRTNTIYVANANDATLSGKGGVTVIDGNTNSTRTVVDPGAEGAPAAVAVNEVRDVAYVANAGGGGNSGSITLIHGGGNSTTSLAGPHTWGSAVVVNATTDQSYVLNSGSLTVVDGASAVTTHALSVDLLSNCNPSTSVCGTGTVASDPAGIRCRLTCVGWFAQGTTVSLTGSPSSGSRFSGWGEACTGINVCALKMDADQVLTATFDAAVAVPALIGATPDAADAALAGAGLVVGTVSEQSSSTVPAGTVLSESPAAGTPVQAGSAVNLVVSTGSPGGGGGGGGTDGLTLTALLGALVFGLRKRKPWSQLESIPTLCYFCAAYQEPGKLPWQQRRPSASRRSCVHDSVPWPGRPDVRRTA